MSEPKPTSNYLDLAGLTVHYLTAGSGTPLLLLHGTALDSAQLTYGALIPELARHYRVIAPDWPGYGKSDKPKLEYSMQFYEAILTAFIKELKLDKFDVAAFSMGGGITLGYALENPERIKRLILIDSYALGGGVHVPLLPFLALRLPGAPSLIWHSLKTSDAFLSFCLRHFVCGQGSSVTPQMVQDVKAQLGLPGLYEAFTDWLTRELGALRLSTNHRHALATINAPTLLIHGGRDLIVPAWRARRAAQLMPNVKAHILPKAGHWTPREASETVLELMLEFLHK